MLFSLLGLAASYSSLPAPVTHPAWSAILLKTVMALYLLLTGGGADRPAGGHDDRHLPTESGEEGDSGFHYWWAARLCLVICVSIPVDANFFDHICKMPTVVALAPIVYLSCSHILTEI